MPSTARHPAQLLTTALTHFPPTPPPPPGNRTAAGTLSTKQHTREGVAAYFPREQSDSHTLRPLCRHVSPRTTLFWGHAPPRGINHSSAQGCSQKHSSTATAIAHLQKRHKHTKRPTPARTHSHVHRQPKRSVSHLVPHRCTGRCGVSRQPCCTRCAAHKMEENRSIALSQCLSLLHVHGRRRQPTAGGEMRHDRPSTQQYFVSCACGCVCLHLRKKEEQIKEKSMSRNTTGTRQRCRGMKEEEKW
ncbi:hypothetical protein MOQ_006472 [Trypanosoma cruzi marinkellei]|uniref:Uncharacterized protein n=1 Tax=Trypanosoma cruzi marinkellei TaxID=85056 RepID=K2N4Y1_TRYCR|nr:hypothetical protein MOQ_006472 [Trypanosoma cruzi marinkellei]